MVAMMTRSGLRVVLVAGTLFGAGCAQTGCSRTEAASHVGVDPDAPLDEPMGGLTALGNKVPKRGIADFPAESRDVFTHMDMRPGDDGALAPLELNADEIKGRNTWLLWAAGNEAFWGWLQQYGYGFADFLKLVDSRKRATRFDEAGLINQPGMARREGSGPYGLHLDEVVQPLPNTDGGRDYGGREWPALTDSQGRTLRSDGVDPAVYGYPSGVVGIRLFKNPDFTPAEEARWDVERFYNDPKYYLDPNLVRPLRVGMSCGVCHVGMHPLSPPLNPNEPHWDNLSSTIGAQHLKTSAVFGNLLEPDNLIYHYLRSQQPGAIDTSLTATDNINNPNTMNAVFDLPARLARARANPAERQGEGALLLPSVEDGAARINPRHTPRVLVDGADSIGAFGALARVYLNIGTFYEQWNRVQNPIIGVKAQRPFDIATCQKNSIYWQVNEKYRTGYLAAFFTHRRVTSPMLLADVARSGNSAAPTAVAALATAPRGWVARGREVFVDNCMVCHSSKQPEGFELKFSERPMAGDTWAHARAESHAPDRYPLTLPSRYADWDAFKKSPAYEAYMAATRTFAEPPPTEGAEDTFLRDNFLAVEQRVPVTLVGTNAGRAVATNGMRGHVWDNFSSEEYKSLRAVGAVEVFDPYSSAPIDAYANNSQFSPPEGGPGYYRPATLIGLWATAPYLHNNALGIFTNDTSVEGRLSMFDDGIRKLLWRKKRRAAPSGIIAVDGTPEGWNTRDAGGWMYRTTTVSDLRFPAKFIRPLITSVVGSWLPGILLGGLYALAALLVLVLVLTRSGYLAAHLPGVALMILGLVAAWVLFGMGLGAFMTVPTWTVPIALFAAGGAALLWLRSRRIACVMYGVGAAAVVLVAILGQRFLDGKLGDLSVGPFPKGTPISLILNLNPEADAAVRLDAIVAMVKGIRAAKQARNEEEALSAFESIAGPALVKASKCPDYTLDRGHWFGESIPDSDKEALIAFLRTL